MKTMDFQQILGKFKALPPKYLFAILGLVFIALLAVDILLIARPQINAMSALGNKAAQLKTDIQALQDNKTRLPQFRVNLELVQRQMKDFEAMVHNEDAIPVVLKTVSTIANQYGIKIDQLVPQKSDGVILVQNGEGKYSSLSILVRARAGYHDLGRFLNRLEQEGVFWQLEMFDVAAVDQEPGRHEVKMQMKILILKGK